MTSPPQPVSDLVANAAAPRNAADWCGWSRAQRQQGRPDRAEFGFRQALALDPTSAVARFDLASLLLDRGDLAAASDLIGDEAADARDRPEILWLRARLAMAQGDPLGAQEPLRRLLDRHRLDDAQRAEALLTLGLALDETGDHGGAIAAARQGKAIQRARYAAVANGREGEVAKLRRIGDWIAAQGDSLRAFPSVEVSGAPATHVFLFGFPRSGTTLLEQVLAAHPMVSTLEEEATLATPYQALLSSDAACAELLRMVPEESAAWAAHYWQGVRARGVAVEGRVFVDKQPAGTLYLPLVTRLFPNARILFALRDPRDVVLSCFRQPFQMNAMTYAFTDLGETAACYDACMTLADRARTVLPLAWHDVRHETLVDDLAGEVERVLAFLDLAPHPATLAFADTARARSIRTPSARQVRAGLDRRGLGRWRQYERDLAPVLPALAPWIDRFGY